MCKTVVKRQDDEHDIVLAASDYGMGLLDIGRVVAMSKKDSLRVCGSSGSVANVCIVVWTNGFVSLLKLLPVLCKKFVSESHHISDENFIFLHVVKLVKDDNLLNHRTLRKDSPDFGNLGS